MHPPAQPPSIGPARPQRQATTVPVPFERAGFAALSDLRSPGFSENFARLETQQAAFLAHPRRYADPRYPWPRDALHNWSRPWEYTFLLHQLEHELASGGGTRLRAVDFGSGSTFFPFVVARLGFHLICLDNDPVVTNELERNVAAIDTAPGSIDVRLNSERLPVEDESADVAYSISVLEHMPDPVPVVNEIARILRPGGLFVLTMDVDVEGSEGVSPEHFNLLIEHLETSFTPAAPERSVPPLDLLTSKSSPWPRPVEPHVPGLMLRTRYGKMLPLIGGPGPRPPVLTVYGAALRRRDLSNFRT